MSRRISRPAASRFVTQHCPADELQRLTLTLSPLFPQPVLPTLHRIDGVEQVSTRPSRSGTDGTEVLNRKSFNGRLREEEE